MRVWVDRTAASGQRALRGQGSAADLDNARALWCPVAVPKTAPERSFMCGLFRRIGAARDCGCGEQAKMPNEAPASRLH